MMRILAAIVAGLILAPTAHAHRVTGLLQASLVEVTSSSVCVEVSLIPGVDVSPQVAALLDSNRDGEFSDVESKTWSALFMSRQRVEVDGKPLPLQLASIRASSLTDMNREHAEIVVNFTADFGKPARGRHTIVCANRYEPMPCSYQVNGLAPKSPGLSITSHRRDEREKVLVLAADFSDHAVPATPTIKSAATIPLNRSAMPLLSLMGLSLSGAIVVALIESARRPRTERGKAVHSG